MPDSPHLLIVDDDRAIRTLLADFLGQRGFRVDVAVDGRGMRKALEVGRFDLVVLDVMLPGEDGLSLCRRIRDDSSLPVILLTALAEETDRVIGLEMGADDYVVKPFSPRELHARIKAVLRRARALPRSHDDPGTVRSFDGWRLDVAKREVRNPEGVLLPLTAGEFDLLWAFVDHPQRVLSRDQLLDLTKGRSATAFDRSIDVQLSRLRRKIEDDPNEPTLIKTVRFGGYLFAPTVTREA